MSLATADVHLLQVLVFVIESLANMLNPITDESTEKTEAVTCQDPCKPLSFTLKMTHYEKRNHSG